MLSMVRTGNGLKNDKYAFLDKARYHFQITGLFNLHKKINELGRTNVWGRFDK